MLCFNTNPPSSSDWADGTKGTNKKTNTSSSGMTVNTKTLYCNTYPSKKEPLQLQPNDTTADSLYLCWSKRIQVIGSEDEDKAFPAQMYSEFRPVSINIQFSFFFQETKAALHVQYAITCHNITTGKGWHVVSSPMTLGDLEAHAESIGLDLDCTSYQSVASMIADAFQLHHVHASTTNHGLTAPRRSCFYVKLVPEEGKSSSVRFQIHMFHEILNTRAVLFSWSVPSYEHDKEGHVGKRFMDGFMIQNHVERDDFSFQHHLLKQWYDRLTKENIEANLKSNEDSSSMLLHPAKIATAKSTDTEKSERQEASVDKVAATSAAVIIVEARRKKKQRAFHLHR